MANLPGTRKVISMRDSVCNGKIHVRNCLAFHAGLWVLVCFLKPVFAESANIASDVFALPVGLASIFHAFPDHLE